MFRGFNRGFAYEGQGGPWEEQGLPWMRHEHHRHHEHGPRFFGMRMGRGPFGPGGGRGPFGPGGRGPFGEGGRFFGRGDLKYALLELLQERPMHGYEMMKALEERSHGFYTPSAGSIYPTLQMLQDRDLVAVTESEGKKTYTITEAGIAFLGERKTAEGATPDGPPWARDFGRRWNTPEFQALRSEGMEVARLFAIAGRTAFQDPQKSGRLQEIIARTHKDLSDLIYGTENKGAPTPPTPPTPPEQA